MDLANFEENEKQGILTGNEGEKGKALRYNSGDGYSSGSEPPLNEDDYILKSMGYKAELNRGLNWFMNFAFGFTEVAAIPSLASCLSYALGAGGAPMVVWGWLVASFFTIIVSYSMAEICSAYPSAGSVYHWAGQLPHENIAPFWSYVTGWFNFLGNGAGDASFASGFAALVDAALIASGTDGLTVYEKVAVSIGIVLIWSLMNILQIEKIGWLTNSAALIQFVTALGVGILVLSITSHRRSASFVFLDTYNDTGFDSIGYVVGLGLLTSLFGFSGYEASAHMAEETHGAAQSAPRGLVLTCVATAISGALFVIPLMFSMSSVPEVLAGETGVAAVDIFLQSCGKAWAVSLGWLLVLNMFFAGMSSVTVTGRITFALIRDNAFPYSDILKGVSEKFKTPVKAIMLVFVFDALILMLPLLDKSNGSLALSAVIQLAVFGFQVSYAIPILLRITYSRNTHFNTSFSLGRWANPFGWLSCVWLFGTSVFFFFPGENPVKFSNMNYTVAVVTLVFVIGAVYWLVSGRRTFKGPVRVDPHDFSSTLLVSESP